MVVSVDLLPTPPFSIPELYKFGKLPTPDKYKEPGIYLFTHRLGEWDALVTPIFHPTSPEEEWELYLKLIPFRGRTSWIGFSPPKWRRLVFSPFFLRLETEPIAVAGWQPDTLVILLKEGMEPIEATNALNEVMYLHSILTGLTPYSEREIIQKLVLPNLV